MKLGVLALQGDFDMHRKALDRIGVESAEVRLPEQLDDVAGLVMPGGESTTLLNLMDTWEFMPALKKFHDSGRPIFGTCAGLILLAREVERPQQFSLGFIDITAERNAYGRQKESFETEGPADLGQGPRPIKMIFIRAPRIRRYGRAHLLCRHGAGRLDSLADCSPRSLLTHCSEPSGLSRLTAPGARRIVW